MTNGDLITRVIEGLDRLGVIMLPVQGRGPQTPEERLVMTALIAALLALDSLSTKPEYVRVTALLESLSASAGFGFHEPNAVFKKLERFKNEAQSILHNRGLGDLREFARIVSVSFTPKEFDVKALLRECLVYLSKRSEADTLLDAMELPEVDDTDDDTGDPELGALLAETPAGSLKNTDPDMDSKLGEFGG